MLSILRASGLDRERRVTQIVLEGQVDVIGQFTAVLEFLGRQIDDILAEDVLKDGLLFSLLLHRIVLVNRSNHLKYRCLYNLAVLCNFALFPSPKHILKYHALRITIKL
jgi:hypothetical protein